MAETQVLENLKSEESTLLNKPKAEPFSDDSYLRQALNARRANGNGHEGNGISSREPSVSGPSDTYLSRALNDKRSHYFEHLGNNGHNSEGQPNMQPFDPKRPLYDALAEGVKRGRMMYGVQRKSGKTPLHLPTLYSVTRIDVPNMKSYGECLGFLERIIEEDPVGLVADDGLILNLQTIKNLLKYEDRTQIKHQPDDLSSMIKLWAAGMFYRSIGNGDYDPFINPKKTVANFNYFMSELRAKNDHSSAVIDNPLYSHTSHR